MSSTHGKILTFTWKIKNYSLCQLKNGKMLKSSVLNTDGLICKKWFLSLYPKGVDKESLGFISCFLYRHEKFKENKNDSSTSCTLEILDPNGKILAFMERKDMDGLGGGLDKFLEVEQLKNEMENWENDELEIRCQLFDRKYIFQPILCETRTEIQMEKNSFDWEVTVPEFQDWSEKIKCRFEERIPIDITLTAVNGKIYFNIQKPDDQPPSEIWKFKISILNKEGIDIGLKNCTHVFESSEFETSFEKNQLEDKSSFTSIHSFKLVCTIYVSDGTLRSTLVSYSCENILGGGLQQLETPPLSLQKDQCENNCDVILRTADERFAAQKCVLSARSPVFYTMFKVTLETHFNILVIESDSEFVRSLLEFLHTGQFANTNPDHVCGLIWVADCYQVISLQEECSRLLISMSNLSPENVCDVIHVADSISDLNLTQFAINYIKANRRLILQSREWTEWTGKKH